MRKIILIALAVLCFDVNAQSLVWGKRLGGTGKTIGTVVETDSTGNVYTGGWFSGITDFDPGFGSDSILAYTFSGYITKLDKNGQLVWARAFGDATPANYNASAYISAIKVDRNGNVYAVGSFIGTIDFDPGPGSHIMTSYDSIYRTDVFILKLSSTGSFVWAKKIGGQDKDEGVALALDNFNNIIITGLNDQSQDFDPGPATYMLPPGVFILKLNTAGNFVWAKSISNVNLSEISNFIQTDAAGNIYYAGSFGLTIDFDPGPGIYNLTASGSGSAFVLKLTSAGNFIWARCTEGSSSAKVYIRSMAVDRSANVYIAGDFFETVDFDPGPGAFNLSSTSAMMVNLDVCVFKLDGQGNFKWAKSFGGAEDDRGYQVATDRINDVYLSGTYRQTVDFDPGVGTISHTSQGRDDIYLSKFDSVGNFLGVKVIGSSNVDNIGGLTVSRDRDIFITGDFYGSLDVDPDASIYNLTTNPENFYNDAYVVKLYHGALGMEEYQYTSSMHVYPNPAHSFFHVEAKHDMFLQLFDLSGQIVLSMELKKEIYQQVALDNLSPGVYFLRGETAQTVVNQKIIITD